MINKNTFSQVVRSITKADHGLRDPQLIHPSREWGIGLTVALLLFIAGTVWSVQIYQTFKSATVQDISLTEGETVVYRASLVEAALTAYDERVATHTQFLKNIELDSALMVPTEGDTTADVLQTEVEQSIFDEAILAPEELASTTEEMVTGE